jgi:hypothetical protein
MFSSHKIVLVENKIREHILGIIKQKLLILLLGILGIIKGTILGILGRNHKKNY